MDLQDSHIIELEEERAELRNARIIQQGLLPKRRHFKRLFENYFTLYIPKKMISGDFYWVGEKNGLRYLVAGDCTGHGVSAALLSVLAMNLFEYAVMNKGIKKTNKILQEVDKRFIESFKNTEMDNFDNPWIDLSIVCVDANKKKIYFSGANRKLLHINSEKETAVYRGDRYPIGGWQMEKKRVFMPQIIPFREGDLLYLGSDGFQDQIGGELNKKYRSERLHDFLNSISSFPMDYQKEKLKEEFESWKNNNEQVDDICILGVQL